ncbi:hypothetical protein D7X74_21360, partial [Corallococcus sp. CA047B]|uniref:hypothetical protein n=1 Tax=Corallococcus sp. CA047B TaxID=2316729 RepID=UPI000EA2BD03
FPNREEEALAMAQARARALRNHRPDGTTPPPLVSADGEKTAAMAALLRGQAPGQEAPSSPAMEGQRALAAALRGNAPGMPTANPSAYNLFAAPDVATADGEAGAMHAALRQQRAAGNLGLLTGDSVLSRFGQAQLAGSGQQEAMLAEAGQQRSGNVLKQALATAKAQQDLEEEKRRREQRLADIAHSDGQRALDRNSREKAAAIAAGDKATQQKLDTESGLRKEVQGNPLVREYQLSAVAYDKVRRAAADPSPAGDLALIFGYMKTLDPTSAVREGEFANAQNAGGIPDRVRNAWNKVLTGERLNPEQRKEFVTSAASQFGALKQRAESLIGGYRDIATDVGVSPTRVVVPGTVVPDIDLEARPASSGQAAAPGAGGSLLILQMQKGKRAVDLIPEGEARRVPMGGGKYRVIKKVNGKLRVLSEG